MVKDVPRISTENAKADRPLNNSLPYLDRVKGPTVWKVLVKVLMKGLVKGLVKDLVKGLAEGHS